MYLNYIIKENSTNIVKYVYFLFSFLFVSLYVYLLTHSRYHTLIKLIVFMNTSSRARQCETVFSILSICNYLLNEAACPPVSTVTHRSCTLKASTHLCVFISTTISVK